MTEVNQKQQNSNLQAIQTVKGVDVKAQQAISVVNSGNTPYQVDVTPVLQQQPYSPFAIALSVAIVIGALAGLMKALKSS